MSEEFRDQRFHASEQSLLGMGAVPHIVQKHFEYRAWEFFTEVVTRNLQMLSRAILDVHLMSFLSSHFFLKFISVVLWWLESSSDLIFMQ